MYRVKHVALSCAEPRDRNLRHCLILYSRIAIQPKTIRVQKKPAQLLKELLRYQPLKSVSLRTREIEKRPSQKVHQREDLVSVENQPAKEGRYETGSLVWAKCNGWPYWPGMVVVDPMIQGQVPEGQKVETPKFVRINKKSKQAESYHVQFFGNGMYRSWIPVERLRPFISWNSWKATADRKMRKLKSVSEQQALIRKVGVKKTRLPDWNLAISEANEARKLDRFARIELLTYQYVDKIENKEVVKPKK